VEATRVQPAIGGDSDDTWDIPSSANRSGRSSSASGRPGPAFSGRSSSGDRQTLSYGDRPVPDPPTLEGSGNQQRPSFSAGRFDDRSGDRFGNRPGGAGRPGDRQQRPVGSDWQPPADPRWGSSSDQQERARALLIPVDDPSALSTTGHVAPVLPGVPEPARPGPVRTHETDTATGGAPCPWCHTLNPVGRHFCRRCAMSLAEKPGAAPVRLSWWRRLFGRRGQEVPYAGQRPRLARNPGRLARLIVTLSVVIILVIVGAVWGPDAVNGIEDHFAHPTITPVSSFTATNSDPKHPVALLHDSYNNTFWATGLSGAGAGVSATATFDQPINLLDVIITPGAGVQPDVFTSEGRPQQLQVSLSDASGKTSTQLITLTDSPGAQTFAIHGQDVASVKFTIVSAFRASTPDWETAIAEIEFFEKS
jgi:hypothetical protein